MFNDNNWDFFSSFKAINILFNKYGSNELFEMFLCLFKSPLDFCDFFFFCNLESNSTCFTFVWSINLTSRLVGSATFSQLSSLRAAAWSKVPSSGKTGRTWWRVWRWVWRYHSGWLLDQICTWNLVESRSEVLCNCVQAVVEKAWNSSPGPLGPECLVPKKRAKCLAQRAVWQSQGPSRRWSRPRCVGFMHLDDYRVL